MRNRILKRYTQRAGVSEPSVLGALLQDHDLTSGLSTEERDSRLREVGLDLFAGTSEPRTYAHMLGLLTDYQAARIR